MKNRRGSERRVIDRIGDCGAEEKIDWRQVGQRITALRALHGLSVQEVAQRTGVSRTKLYQLERGETENLTIELVRRLCHGLQTSGHQLLFGHKCVHDKSSMYNLAPEEADLVRGYRAMGDRDRQRLLAIASALGGDGK